MSKKKGFLDYIITEDNRKELEKSKKELSKSVEELKKVAEETFGPYKGKSNQNNKKIENNKKTIKEPMDTKRKKYCTKCGAKIDEDDLFCKKCGNNLKRNINNVENKKQEKPKPTSSKKESSKKTPQSIKEEKKKIYNCPNCGASLNSFTSICPYCLTEVRNVESSKSVKEFSENINRLPKNALENYIINYPVPNDKEDLLEFLILVSSNIDCEFSKVNNNINIAWIKKFDQLYEKGNLIFKNTEDIKLINSIYNKKMDEIKNNKIDHYFTVVVAILCYIGFLIFLMMSLFNFYFALAIVFFGFAILIIAYYVLKGENCEVFKTSIRLNKRKVKIISIILIIVSASFLGIGIFNYEESPENLNYKNYLDKDVAKYDVEVEIEFVENLIFNKYNVDFSLYDIEERIYHGKDKTINIKLPEGTHIIEFTGDGMREEVELKVKGNTKVSYKITCHETEIEIIETNSEYNLKK